MAINNFFLKKNLSCCVLLLWLVSCSYSVGCSLVVFFFFCNSVIVLNIYGIYFGEYVLDLLLEKAWGNWLRATGRWSTRLGGNRWLRDDYGLLWSDESNSMDRTPRGVTVGSEFLGNRSPMQQDGLLVIEGNLVAENLNQSDMGQLNPEDLALFLQDTKKRQRVVPSSSDS